MSDNGEVARAGELIRAERLGQRWLIPNLLDSVSKLIIGAEAKSFKSWVGLELAWSVATGQGLFGMPDFVPLDTGPVLYIDAEMGRNVIQDRMKAIAVARAGQEVLYNDYDPEMLFFLDANINLSSEHQQKVFMAQVDQMPKPKLIVFDPLYNVAGATDENSSSAVREFLTFCNRLRNRYETAVCLIHHYGKPKYAKDGKQINQNPAHRLRGSSAFGGWFSTLWALERPSPTQAKIHWTIQMRSGLDIERRSVGFQIERLSLDEEEAGKVPDYEVSIDDPITGDKLVQQSPDEDMALSYLQTQNVIASKDAADHLGWSQTKWRRVEDALAARGEIEIVNEGGRGPGNKRLVSAWSDRNTDWNWSDGEVD